MTLASGNAAGVGEIFDAHKSIARTLRSRFGDGVRMIKEPAHWTAALGEPITRQYCPPFADPNVPCETFQPAAMPATEVVE